MQNILDKFIRKNKYLNLLRKSLPYPEKKFLVYTRGRTGSTVLSELLNCHPDIFCDVEIFNYLYSDGIIKYPVPYINSCSKRASIHKKPVYGFKVKIAQLRYEHHYSNYEDILKRLYENGYKFIYLKRVNFLRHKLSNFLITNSKIIHIRNGDKKKPDKIWVDCKLLLEGIKYSEGVEKTEEKNLKDIPHLKLVYEEDLIDNSMHQKAADKVFSYLDLKSVKVNTGYKRIINDNLEDHIINYDEVYNYFKDTEYSKYLNEKSA